LRIFRLDDSGRATAASERAVRRALKVITK
jgi:hypothetical protein